MSPKPNSSDVKQLAERVKTLEKQVIQLQSQLQLSEQVIDQLKQELSLLKLNNENKSDSVSEAALPFTTLYNLGIKAYQEQNYKSALELFIKCLALQPNFAPLLYNLGLTSYKLNSLVSAKQYLQRSLENDPNYREAKQLLNELVVKEIDEKAANLSQDSLEDKMNAYQTEFSNLIQKADQLISNHQSSVAVQLYKNWAQQSDSPYVSYAYYNIGTILFNQNDFLGAQDAYVKSIELNPAIHQSRLNLGIVYEKTNQVERAIKEWQTLIDQVDPSSDALTFYIQALNHMGRNFESMRDYDSALKHLTESLKLDPDQPDVIHHWVYLREKVCSWPIYDPDIGIETETLKKSTSAIAMLSLADDPALQLKVAKQYSQKKISQNVSTLTQGEVYGHKKIRVAFCSSDFCIHPVSMLTVEMFELLDRKKFEVYGFCWTNVGHSDLRQRVMDAMDHFITIGDLSDEEAAQCIRKHEIDILFDLHGQTQGARMDMLAYRPAPIQITYLGLPATTGLSYIDYVIADKFIIPEESAQYYSEKPIYMPEIFQVSDRQRKHSKPLKRKEYGLPEKGIVFCCFNNNYKVTPEIFESWMNILNQVENSVLWLLSDNPWSEENLKKQAKKYSIDSERLIFAKRATPEDYLARYAVADLFLDTYPFNGGTTANDVLWMGLPIVTYCGKTFSSRMAGALLTAAGLEELITYNIKDYQAKAIKIATTRGKCKRLRTKLENVKREGVLFDTPRFLKHLENQLLKLVKK